jgi:hypothetical protein
MRRGGASPAVLVVPPDLGVLMAATRVGADVAAIRGLLKGGGRSLSDTVRNLEH